MGIRKGVPWLLRAFKGLSDHAELGLISSVEKGFEKMLEAEILGGVVVRGAVLAVTLPDDLHADDLFCLPSLEEGFSLSLLQVMTSGLPVITTPDGGAEDIIHDGIDGLIVRVIAYHYAESGSG